MANEWKLSGTYFESCNCEAACPCVFLSAPSTGECTVVVGWHIDHGHFGAVNLDGLNVVLAVYSPGHMIEVKWQAALYLDSAASQEQGNALAQIFSGQAGGHPARLGQHIGTVLGVANKAIDYTAAGKRRSLRINGILDVEIEAMGGQNNADITIEGHPLCIAPGYPVVVSKSKQLNYQDHGLKWELSDKNGFYSPFSYQN
jgi:hypothetical protein